MARGGRYASSGAIAGRSSPSAQQESLKKTHFGNLVLVPAGVIHQRAILNEAKDQHDYAGRQ